MEILQPFVYGLLAVVAFIEWRRHPGPSGAWLAAAFGTLGFVVVAGQLLPESSTDPVVVWAQKAILAILVFFPYLLYRFMTTMIRPIRWIWITGSITTGLLAISAFVLPPFPETDVLPTWFQIYIAALLIDWVFLSGVVAARLWRAGRQQPTVTRRRMRMMSLGALGLALALVVAGEFSDAGPAELIVQLLVLVVGPLMLVGFAPPYALRASWRRREEAALDQTSLSLMAATSPTEVARSLLPHARRLVGATVAVLQDADGELIASDGLGEEESRAAIESFRNGRSASDRSTNGSLMVIPMRSGRLTVVGSPFAPFFGDDEIATVRRLAAMADLALARTRLIESQRRLAEIVESSADAIIGQSLDGTIRSWNRGAERIYGYSAEDVLGRPITIVVPPGLEGDAAAILGKIRDNESVENYETQRRTKDGRVIDVSLTVSPITDADGTVVGASAIGRDITDLKRAAEVIRSSEERNRTIIDTAKEAYIEIDERSVVREWNAAAAVTFGIPRADALGRPLPDLIIPARYREAHFAGMAKFLETGEGAVLNTTVELSAMRGAEEFPVELTIWPVGRAPGATFHAFVRDISERKTAERVVTEAREEAERANRAKSDFLSRMSHELRTPMNAVLGFSQLMEMTSLTPEQKSDTKEIIKAGRHLLELIDEVLDISRIEAGRLRLSLEPVDVVDVVEECVSLLTPLANQEGVGVNLARDGIPDRSASVVADRQRLKQVILNLIANAIKYNREGGSVGISFEPADPSRLRIHVTDTGHGIPAGRMEQLFAPFERLGAEVSEVEGTGLGLALSKALVEAMGGTISVHSEVGTGSTFSVELASAQDVPTSLETEAATLEGVAPVGTFSTSRTVLYVEDNLSNLKLVERLVAQRSNINLVSAMQGGIGLTLARDHRPDLILLDLNLPDMPGEEVLARLHSDPRTAAVPVVVISADATSGQIRRLLDAGARAYLTKPIDVGRFFEIINEFCAER